MKNRHPLRHVPLFWIGLLPVVALLWAWADSNYIITQWRHSPDPFHFTQLQICQSRIRYEHYYPKEPIVPGQMPPPPLALPIIHPASAAPRGEWLREPPASGYMGPWLIGWFPPPVLELGGTDQPHDSYRYQLITIPYWLLLALWLPPWWCLTRWQARRLARRHALAEAALNGEAQAG